MVQVHLIDGTFELFRAFFSAPSAQDASGREVGATRGLLRSFNALLKQPQVTHVACAFDSVIESFRNQLFDGYKTGAGIEPALLQQFELVERAVEALGITVWRMTEFEADDALATAAHRFAADSRVDRVVICSPDKDLCQCLTDAKVELWDRIRDTRLDAAAAESKFGVSPASIPDYLALVGDTADGIPGIPRWGAKSSARLLARYGSIDRIPIQQQKWDVKVRGAQSLAKELNSRRQEATLYRQLATLRQDVPLEETLDQLEYRGACSKELESVLQELDWTGKLVAVRYR